MGNRNSCAPCSLRSRRLIDKNDAVKVTFPFWSEDENRNPYDKPLNGTYKYEYHSSDKNDGFPVFKHTNNESKIVFLKHCGENGTPLDSGGVYTIYKGNWR